MILSMLIRVSHVIKRGVLLQPLPGSQREFLHMASVTGKPPLPTSRGAGTPLPFVINPTFWAIPLTPGNIGETFHGICCLYRNNSALPSHSHLRVSILLSTPLLQDSVTLPSLTENRLRACRNTSRMNATPNPRVRMLQSFRHCGSKPLWKLNNCATIP